MERKTVLRKRNADHARVGRALGMIGSASQIIVRLALPSVQGWRADGGCSAVASYRSPAQPANARATNQ